MGGCENEVVLAPFFLVPRDIQELGGGIGRRRRNKLHAFLVVRVPFDFLVEQLNVARRGNSLLLHVLPPKEPELLYSELVTGANAAGLWETAYRMSNIGIG
jgi:hypothetical protein